MDELKIGDEVVSTKDGRTGVVQRTVIYAVVKFDDDTVKTRSTACLTKTEGGETT